MTKLIKLSWPGVIGGRLSRHHLLDPARRQLGRGGFRYLCAHAQVGASAELTLGLRVRAINRQQVRAARWEDRTLVKNGRTALNATCLSWR